MDIAPSKEGMPREYTWLDVKYVLVPNVVGLTRNEAKKALKDFKVEYSGNGNNVIYQAPNEGYYAPAESTIKLLLG